MFEQQIIESLPSIALIAATAVSVSLLIRSRKNPGSRPAWVTSATAFLISYVMIVATVQAVDFYLGWRLNMFDLNGDGSFSPAEQTADQIRFFDAVVLDTARTFIPFTGVIYAALSLGLAHAIAFSYRGIQRLTNH